MRFCANHFRAHGGDIFPIEKDFPFGRRKDARANIEERRFPRAVGADDAENVSGINLHIHVFHGLQAAKVLADSLRLKKRGTFAAGLFSHGLPRLLSVRVCA